ncbi:hypothetical protein SISNIDRAFT_248509 [Sistotremastrum niveocremeum HHB9708]|uniref:DUF6535 domain-containing protein n=1 Tax=Sistotremastrum niveocremeum HHB9708 TaxID=1314777 RepID=A0A164YU64_9AGAM|nr:hypothetical protein SISNIDRAFT_248509 [Sistotremastrum niveocremeum HHB9708]
MKNQARPVHDAADFHDKMLQHMQEQGEVLRRISSSLDRIDAFKSVPPPAAASGPSTREPLKHQEGSLLRRTLDDDLGWSAVMKVALEKLHSLLASWKESLDTILLFIALFSAIAKTQTS